jgi:hypothetical protein
VSRARWPRKHGSRISCEAEVELDVDEVLEQLSDDDLLEELEARNAKVTSERAINLEPFIETVTRIAECLRRGWHQEALANCERLVDRATGANIPLSRIPEIKAGRLR